MYTFCAFIDFRKAYDRIKLWRRLSDIGVGGKLFRFSRCAHLLLRASESTDYILTGKFMKGQVKICFGLLKILVRYLIN